jgi:electron transfer flavoprotein-quinone oxidoreductase
MKQYKFDVVIIGAGPAGVTAAGALAGTGISVALLEAGVYAGAENWSGCVYFTESLAAPDCFGTDAVAAAPFERRVHRRGTLMHNGLDVVGVELTDPNAFTNCYTVLRPVYDPYFAHLARQKGVFYSTETTVTSLMRDNNRVVGVETNRGPLYAGVVFIAEGDASHLVRSEGLERTPEPHYLQGVKATLSLPSREIEKRFGLGPGEGAAFEILIRNASLGGRTAKLNAGGFLYTNRDSLSVGYVAPLDNVRNNFRGDHDRVFEWMRGLPYIKDLTEGAALSAYGAKIIRSGGWRERPVLVEDGLAVGGASAGLGIDIPFPNFTGPASATGLYFARAVRAILLAGRAPNARNLEKEYVAPLRESVYGKNARHLSLWPKYFGSSKVLFGRSADLACGAARFLSSGSLAQTGRFFRNHLLSFRALRESAGDVSRAVGSLRLWKPLAFSFFNPATVWAWCSNLLMPAPSHGPGLNIILSVKGEKIDAAKLPFPLGGMIRRCSPGLGRALSTVYANDGKPAKQKFSEAVRAAARSLRLTDLLVVPAYGLFLFCVSLGVVLWDAFRFYALKTPVEKFLAEPVMAYDAAQKKARDLDAVKPSSSLEAKLATNTYRVGATPHIRTLWPGDVRSHPDMAQAGLWWVCPARVYTYDAPPFSGRGAVAVNYENCIKCESCWRAEPGRVLWGRQTDHKLVYRPESAALPVLFESIANARATAPAPAKRPEIVDEKLWNLSPAVLDSARTAILASAAFRQSVEQLPASASKSRLAWPDSLGRRLGEKLASLEAALSNDGRYAAAQTLRSERDDLGLKLSEGRTFHALYRCRGIERKLRSWTESEAAPGDPGRGNGAEVHALPYESVSAIFPDRVVKQWEDEAMPDEWAEKLRTFLRNRRETPLDAVRELSYVNPSLGLIAAAQYGAEATAKNAGLSLGLVAAEGDHVRIDESIDSVRLRGTLSFVPVSAADALLVLSRGKGHIVPFGAPGVSVVPTPAIGFRAAGLSDVSLDCAVQKKNILFEGPAVSALSYLAIALGTADYLCKRVKEHAAGRIQFPGQMLDTEGRNGIAKLGAVKAMIGRTEAWRLLLQTLFDSHSLLRGPRTAAEFDLLCSAVSAVAFGPEPGTMGYDAGQVFGGFAYSEDDLLSRSYRDSSLFRFLAPGYGAAAKLHEKLTGKKLDRVLPPLGAVKAVRGEPFGPFAARWTALAETRALAAPGVDASLAGEAEAILLGARVLLSSMAKDLAGGRSSEAGSAALETLLGIADGAVKKAELSAGRGTVPPAAVFPVEPLKQVTLESDYEAFCSAPGAPHVSGSFLVTAFDRSPRFVPEMQLHDPKLAARWSKLVLWFKQNCQERKFDGLHVERYIEKLHRIPDEILRAAKENKWLATYIPPSEDGLGWRKAEYYILNAAAGSFGDAAIDLLIMASTSIGTTPILLGLEDELPRVREELSPLAQDEERLGEPGKRLDKLIRSLASPNPAWIKKEYEAVMKLVDERIRRTRVVKYLAANFLRAFYGAGLAGRRGDFAGFAAGLRRAGELFAKLMPDVRSALDELPRRERCHKLFLRYLGHGGVSAFALTEPTAGSDSGGVKTTAKLTSLQLTPLDDGRYSFYLNDKDETNIRYLIDADKIVFNDGGIAYRTPDRQTAAIRYDRYDYAADQGVRTYFYQGKECPFHDIGQVRNSNSGPVYEHYVLTGAKMWITNGSIATQFCLYAQTPEGVTGFMVDRHAEGLKVGADEKKTGQRGSPTNEISIDGMRVPREAVIGYEGHGQVNALETLNVGRCGLAVVSGALMRKLMLEAVREAPSSRESESLLGEAAAVLFGSESLAYYLVGLFDRTHESVRMESAIAKYACSEDIHELLTLVERAYGPAGQTEKFLLEKARRDSRILTIYEGTNEVQRFLILKDLMAQAASWQELPEPEGDDKARTLAAWKNALRKQVKAVSALLGDSSWSDAMLQPALFPLAEMAGEILRLECVYHRLEWLEHRSTLLARSSHNYAALMRAAGRRSAERTVLRLEHLAGTFALAWENVKSGMDMPEARAADAVLDAMEEKAPFRLAAPGVLDAPIHVLCIVRPVAELSPRPRVRDGAVHELVWRLDPADLSGLSQALALKAASGPRTVVDVLLAGRADHEDLLRQAAGGRADSLHRLNADADAGARAYAKAVRDREVFRSYDLIIVGAECQNGDQDLGAYLAGSLKKLHYRRERLEVKPDGTGLLHVALPAVVGITGKDAGPSTDMADVVESTYAEIRVTTPDERSWSRDRFEPPAGAAKTTAEISDTLQAAAYLKAFAASASASTARPYAGSVPAGALADNDAVWAVLGPNDPKSNLAVLRASARTAALLGVRMRAAIAAPGKLQPEILGLAAANGCEQAWCLDTQDGRLSNDGKRSLLRLLAKTARPGLVFAGMEWTGSFAFAAGEAETANETILLCSGVIAVEKQGGDKLVFSLPVYEGKLVRHTEYRKGPAFFAVSPDADFPAPSGGGAFEAFALAVELDADWLMPLPPAAPPSLSRADVIIDLGYGLKDRTGLALAQELKRKLEALGLAPLFGATRKVTQDLKLLPLDAQIGQTGVRVNPKVVIALGISGAPQHVDYIGAQCEILCFNKDPEAPLMKLNRTRPFPRVHPIEGDLFATVRDLIEKLD